MIISSQLNEWFFSNLWSIISLTITLAFAIYFYLKSKKVKLPLYSHWSINIINELVNKFESLEMTYSGLPIENLTVTKILFWNGGNDTIDNQDISRVDPLKIHLKENYKILESNVLYSKNPANQFSVKTACDKSDAILKFDYLDKDEGGIVQLIHTGISDKDIEIQGTIKGGGKPIHAKQHLYIFNSPKIKRNIFIVVTLLLSFCITITFLKFNITLSEKIIVCVIFVGFTFLYWGILFYLSKRKIPKGFEIDWEGLLKY